MSERQVLLATRPPFAKPWQLALPDRSLPYLLIGWSMPLAFEREAGVPAPVARLLARALLRVGALTYPCSSAPGLGLVTTADAAVASELFDDPGFPWWMQGQVVLVSGAKPVVESNRDTWLILTDPRLSLTPSHLSSVGALAILRPGVDGDVAKYT